MFFGGFGGHRGVAEGGSAKDNGGECPGVAVGCLGAELEPIRCCRAGWVFYHLLDSNSGFCRNCWVDWNRDVAAAAGRGWGGLAVGQRQG